MRAAVPAAVVDNSYSAFQPGYYNGQIAGAEIRTPQEGWQVIKLVVDNITPQEGTNDPGRTRFQGDLTIETDGVNLFEVEDFGKGDLPFMIRKSAGLLAGLAEGLGVGERVNGIVHADLKQVAEALIAGQFKGEKIGFEVANRPNKKDPEKPYDGYNRFGKAQ